MNASALSDYAFTGSVRCERRGTQLLLAGTERTTSRPLQLLLTGVAGAALPASVDDLALYVTTAAADGAESGRCRLEWRDGGCGIEMRSVHVSWGADAPLAAAMPGLRASWRGRMGWALLLNLVRVPGMTRVLRAIRGAN